MHHRLINFGKNVAWKWPVLVMGRVIFVRIFLHCKLSKSEHDQLMDWLHVPKLWSSHRNIFFTIDKVQLQYRCWIQSSHFSMLTFECHLFNNQKSAQHNKSRTKKLFYLKLARLYISIKLICSRQVLHWFTKINDNKLIYDIDQHKVISNAQST